MRKSCQFVANSSKIDKFLIVARFRDRVSIPYLIPCPYGIHRASLAGGSGSAGGPFNRESGICMAKSVRFACGIHTPTLQSQLAEEITLSKRDMLICGNGIAAMCIY